LPFISPPLAAGVGEGETKAFVKRFNDSRPYPTTDILQLTPERENKWPMS
jgi:hypothetical protein